MRNAKFTLLALVGAVLSGTAAAEDLIPLPSVPDYTSGDGWGFALGGGVEYETSYDGSDEFELEISPYGALQWRTGDNMLFWENNEAGWRGVRGDWLLQLGARYESGREADDSDDGRLDGLEETDGELTAFGEVRWTPDGDWRNWLGGRVFGGGDVGVLALAAAGRRFGENAEAFVYTTFANSKFNNRDFGISGQEATASGLPAFDADGGFRSAGITAIYRQPILENVEIIASGGVEFYFGDLSDSPISRKDYEPEISITALYIF